jgi:hypothetical protein
MLSRELAPERYPQAVLDALHGTGTIDRVFGQNAARLFKL